MSNDTLNETQGGFQPWHLINLFFGLMWPGMFFVLVQTYVLEVTGSAADAGLVMGIIGLGALFLLWAAVGGIGGLAVPATIMAGIGGILYYQNLTGDWDSWSYIWALIPGFVGVGVLLSGLIDGKFKSTLDGGVTLVIISAILFFIFGTTFGLDYNLSQYWPVLLILLGLISLVRVLFRRKKKVDQ